MKVHITVTDGQGATFEGNAELVRVSKSTKTSKAVAKVCCTPARYQFILFIEHARIYEKACDRHERFQKIHTVTCAPRQGKVGKEVSGEQIASTWNRIKNLFRRSYNAVHATRAKADGWIDTPNGDTMRSRVWKKAVGQVELCRT